MHGWEKTLVARDTTLREAIQKIDAAGTQIALVVDDQRHLIGTLSDGDIRRGLLKGLTLASVVADCMFPKPTVVRETDSRDFALSLMRRLSVRQIPVLNANDQVIGLQTLDEFISPKIRNNWVVVMAGGLGSRLRELTQSTPKPMLHVGGRPLLETILRSYIDQGFRKFYLAVNFKAEIIESYFGDGSSLGAEIRYLRESKRLGTAGALSLLPEKPDAPIFVTNGDLLVKADYVDMLNTHTSDGAMATMGVREFEFQIPYGVVQTNNGAIQHIEEKPIHRSLVSAGIYVLSPQALSYIPSDTFFDMPTLFDELLLKNHRARCHTISGYWLDIGRIADYEKANSDYTGFFE